MPARCLRLAGAEKAARERSLAATLPTDKFNDALVTGRSGLLSFNLHLIHDLLDVGHAIRDLFDG